jgi:hypothetical protein
MLDLFFPADLTAAFPKLVCDQYHAHVPFLSNCVDCEGLDAILYSSLRCCSEASLSRGALRVAANRTVAGGRPRVLQQH